MAFCRTAEQEKKEEMGRCPVRRDTLVFCYTMAALSEVYYLSLPKQQLPRATHQPSIKRHICTVLVLIQQVVSKISTKQDL